MAELATENMQARHLLPLTGIRFFAAAWVVLYHFQAYLVPLCPALNCIGTFSELGYQAVPFFFMLSGFVLSHNYFAEYSLAQVPRFLFLRFARLWPVHMAVLMVMLAGPDTLRLSGPAYVSLGEEILMVRSWFNSGLAWNYPAWSISIEWFAYIFIFPVGFLLFKRLQSRIILVLLVGMCLAAQAVLPSTLLPGRCESIVFLFLAGSGLYRMYQVIANPPAEAVTLCGVIILAFYILFNRYLSVFVLYLAFALLLYGLAYERGFVAQFLSRKWVVRGGLISYSLYMTHVLILRNYQFYLWERVPHAWFLRLLILLTLIVLLLVTAAVFYCYIEEPANRKLRSMMRKALALTFENPVILTVEEKN